MVLVYLFCICLPTLTLKITYTCGNQLKPKLYMHYSCHNLQKVSFTFLLTPTAHRQKPHNKLLKKIFPQAKHKNVYQTFFFFFFFSAARGNSIVFMYEVAESASGPGLVGILPKYAPSEATFVLPRPCDVNYFTIFQVGYVLATVYIMMI